MPPCIPQNLQQPSLKEGGDHNILEQYVLMLTKIREKEDYLLFERESMSTYEEQQTYGLIFLNGQLATNSNTSYHHENNAVLHADILPNYSSM